MSTSTITATCGDAFTFGDTVNRLARIRLSVPVERMMFVDNLNNAARLKMTASDAIALSDSVIAALRLKQTANDAFTMQDTLVSQLASNLRVLVSDNLSMTDSVTYVVSTAVVDYLRRYLNDVESPGS